MTLRQLLALAITTAVLAGACNDKQCEKLYIRLMECKIGRKNGAKIAGRTEFVERCKAYKKKKNSKMMKAFLACADETGCTDFTECVGAQLGTVSKQEPLDKLKKRLAAALAAKDDFEVMSACTQRRSDYPAATKKACETYLLAYVTRETKRARSKAGFDNLVSFCRGRKHALGPATRKACKQTIFARWVFGLAEANKQIEKALAPTPAAAPAGDDDDDDDDHDGGADRAATKLCEALKEAGEAVGDKQKQQALTVCDDLALGPTVGGAIAKATAQAKTPSPGLPYACKKTLKTLASRKSSLVAKLRSKLIAACYVTLGKAILTKATADKSCSMNARAILAAVKTHGLKDPALLALLPAPAKACKKEDDKAAKEAAREAQKAARKAGKG